jgi:hypothetical protein
VDWGDAPTWLAALLAGIAGIVAYKVYRVESARDERAEAAQRERDAEQRRSQAIQISGWYNIKSFGPRDLAGSAWRAQVFNGSDQPVYDVRIYFHHFENESNVWGPIVSAAKAIHVIPPGDEGHKPPPEEILEAMEKRDVSRLTISFAFRDAGNRWWQRKPDGILAELGGPPDVEVPFES